MTRSKPSQVTFADLVDIKDDAFRVHSSLYTDQDLFELEMVEIFEKTWIYVGHESEIAQPGDYRTAMIGRKPIIITRDKNGALHALLNVCRHRANAVCREERGNSFSFRCPYHAWTYQNTGRLVGVSDRSRYPRGFTTEGLDLIKVPRLETYRGLIFASLSPEGLDLARHLEPIKDHIDLWADRSIGAESTVLIPHRYGYHGNWKFQCENGVDGYHPGIVHESAFSTFAEFEIGNFPTGASINRGDITRGCPAATRCFKAAMGTGAASPAGCRCVSKNTWAS